LPDSRQELIAMSADKITVLRDEEGYLIEPDDSVAGFTTIPIVQRHKLGDHLADTIQINVRY
jgi:hypothetical protein